MTEKKPDPLETAKKNVEAQEQKERETATPSLTAKPSSEQNKLTPGKVTYKKPQLSEGLFTAMIQPTEEGQKVRPATATKQDILEEAIGTVGSRFVSYDAPENNFARIAAHWNVYLENIGLEPSRPLSPHDIAMLMTLLKIARLEFNPTHHDSFVDVAGYAACGGEIAAKEREKP